ncbi:MAG: hypothetical protein RL122_2664 [Pseudomonadota bacterium]|jgi:predicted ATP-binding protein involved in virulence
MSTVTTFKINSLELKNFRAFESLSIDFHDNLTVLVAKNGEGKTSVIDAVAIALTPFVQGFDDIKGRSFERDDVRLYQVRKTRSNEMEYAVDGTTIKTEATFYQLGNVEWVRQRSSTKQNKGKDKNTSQLIELAHDLQNSIRTIEVAEKTILPLVALYGTNRLWSEKATKETDFDITSRTIGYSACLNSSTDFKSFEKWFIYWAFSSLSHKAELLGRAVEELQANARNQTRKTNNYRNIKNRLDTEFDGYIASIQHALNICLKITGWQKINYDFGKQEIVGVHPKNGMLPIHLLSDGVRSMIALVADIAFRATKLNPHLGAEASCKTPGIVLIDEVDMHLHPEWQQLVLGGLTAAFPEIQFIVTTHSPQVLTTVPPECIRELSRDGDNVHVIIPEFSLGAESPYVLESIQGVHTRPQHLEIVQELNEYQHLIAEDQWDTPRAVVLREKLNAWGHGFEPALVKMDMDIRMRAYRRGQATR